MPGRDPNPNRGLRIAIIGLAVSTVVALFFAYGSIGQCVSGALLVVICGALLVNYCSILYKGLGQRSLTLTVTFFTAGIGSILLLFANIYRWGGLNDPARKIECGSNSSFLDALYFSVVTWTTLGYGDITPCPDIRWVAALEALAGFVVMALLIAVLVTSIENLHRPKKPPP